MVSLKIYGTIETDPGRISNYVTSYYNTLFTTSLVTKDNELTGEVIPHLIIDNINNMLTLNP